MNHCSGDQKNLAASLDKINLHSEEKIPKDRDKSGEVDHGEWLVVTKSKRNKGKTQGKGTSSNGKKDFQSKDTQVKDTQSKATRNHQTSGIILEKSKQKDSDKLLQIKPFVNPLFKGKEQILDGVCFSKGKGSGNLLVTDNSNESTGSELVIFKSQPLLNSSPGIARKKRHRIDLHSTDVSFRTDQSMTDTKKNRTIEGKNEGNFSFQSQGIKTTMNVEVISNNRLRFRDEEDPGGTTSPKLIMALKEVDLNHDSDDDMNADSDDSQ
ncbi:EF-Hand 1, calcium-binding site [Sesbania bispinosa]|nr:EF-Hand 1, calcium-binding site [Sesbania bispinosa]